MSFVAKLHGKVLSMYQVFETNFSGEHIVYIFFKEAFRYNIQVLYILAYILSVDLSI